MELVHIGNCSIDQLVCFCCGNLIGNHFTCSFDRNGYSSVANVTLGMAEDGILLFNSPRAPEEVLEDLRSGVHGYRLAAGGAQVMTVDATGIGLELLGRPIPNTALMGALTAAWDGVRIESVERVIREHFGDKAEPNVRAAHAGRERLRRPAFAKRGG